MSVESRKKMSIAKMGNTHTLGKHWKRPQGSLSTALYGENHPMFGKHHKEETKQRLREALKGKYTGELSRSYKGDDISVNRIHVRMRQMFGEPEECEGCGRMGLKGQKVHWSNKDHSYRLPLRREDWQRLCVSCHRKYDFSLIH